MRMMYIVLKLNRDRSGRFQLLYHENRHYLDKLLETEPGQPDFGSVCPFLRSGIIHERGERGEAAGIFPGCLQAV